MCVSGGSNSFAVPQNRVTLCNAKVCMQCVMASNVLSHCFTNFKNAWKCIGYICRLFRFDCNFYSSLTQTCLFCTHTRTRSQVRSTSGRGNGQRTKRIEAVSACRLVFIQTRSRCLFHVTPSVLARRAYLSFVIACTRSVQRHRARVAERSHVLLPQQLCRTTQLQRSKANAASRTTALSL